MHKLYIDLGSECLDGCKTEEIMVIELGQIAVASKFFSVLINREANDSSRAYFDFPVIRMFCGIFQPEFKLQILKFDFDIIGGFKINAAAIGENEVLVA